MRIAQVAPLYERVPPISYGGTERIVSYLTEGLINEGHDVTLFASGDSITQGHLISPCKRSLRLDQACRDPLAYHFLQLEQIFQHARCFDIIHFHIDYLHYPFSRRIDVPHITTQHGRLDLPDLGPLYREYADMPMVSISNSQRKPLPRINWQGTVYHGIPLDLYNYQKNQGTISFSWEEFLRKKELTEPSRSPSVQRCGSRSLRRSTTMIATTWKRRFSTYWIIRSSNLSARLVKR